MATDATATPTALGIPKYATSADAPSGKGFNASMDSIDSLFQTRVTVAGTSVWQNKLVSTDANPAFQVLGDGTHRWGAGGASVTDTTLWRSGAQQLKTDSAFIAVQTLTYNPATAVGFAFGSVVGGESNYRFTVGVNGLVSWGVGGATAPDTALSRNAARVLLVSNPAGSLNGGIIANAGVATLYKSGAVSDADIPAGLQTGGVLAYDETNLRLYIRSSGGVWKSVLLS
jgi:hypothetical protein